MYANAYQQYKQQTISTMTPMDMVVKLFSEAEREISRAIFYINNKNFGSANESIVKAQTIIQTLQGSLDMQYEVSDGLNALYSFFVQQLIQANLKKDVAILGEVLPMLVELRETFSQINKAPR